MQSTKTASVSTTTPTAAAATPAMKAVLPVSASSVPTPDACPATAMTLCEGEGLEVCEGVVVGVGVRVYEDDCVPEVVRELVGVPLPVPVSEVVKVGVELGDAVETCDLVCERVTVCDLDWLEVETWLRDCECVPVLNCDDVPVTVGVIDAEPDDEPDAVPDELAVRLELGVRLTDVDGVRVTERTMAGKLRRSDEFVPFPVAFAAAATTLSGGGPVRASERTEIFPMVLRPPVFARLATWFARATRRSVCATAAAAVASEVVALDGSRITVGLLSRIST